MTYVPQGLRAPKGSVSHRLTLRIPPELWLALQASAKRDKTPPTEWCRQVLERAAARAKEG